MVPDPQSVGLEGQLEPRRAARDQRAAGPGPPLLSGWSFKPSVEVGIRQDGGEAEVGTGLDVGGGLVLADGPSGLQIDRRVRTLVMHQHEDFREHGFALAISYSPTPSIPLGLSAEVTPSWGSDAMAAPTRCGPATACTGSTPARTRATSSSTRSAGARLRASAPNRLAASGSASTCRSWRRRWSSPGYTTSSASSPKIHHRTDIPRRTDLGDLPNYRTHKHRLFGEQEGRCAGCRMMFPFRNFEVDHVIPRARGGADQVDNLQLLCGACNRAKGTGTQPELLAKLRKRGQLAA